MTGPPPQLSRRGFLSVSAGAAMAVTLGPVLGTALGSPAAPPTRGG